MKLLQCGVVAVLSLGVVACSSSSMPSAPSSLDSSVLGESASASAPEFAGAAKPGTTSIVGIVQGSEDFDVLEAAVIRAGLVGALSASNQLTVFAPTDAAFVKSLDAADEAGALAMVAGLPVADLTNILLYHVTEGRRNSRSVLAAPSYRMLNGGTLTREKLSAAGLARTDISASNGIVHVINAVLLP